MLEAKEWIMGRALIASRKFEQNMLLFTMVTYLFTKAMIVTPFMNDLFKIESGQLVAFFLNF
jgi:hypothetical protein